LRHDRRRARHRARQVQEAGRRRGAQDRQQHGAGGAPPPGLRRARDPGGRRVHRRAGDHRGRARAQARAPAGLRLRLQAGTPGEIFIKMAKEGSTISGLMDTIGVLTSMALQYGVPLEVLVSKFSHVRFEPSGFTKNPDIPMAKSLIDYVFRFLGSRFLSGEARAAVGLVEREAPRAPGTVSAVAAASPAAHAPAGPNP